MTTEIS